MKTCFFMKWATKETYSNISISSTTQKLLAKERNWNWKRKKALLFRNKNTKWIEQIELHVAPRVLSFKFQICRDVKNHRHNFYPYTLTRFCKKNLIFKKKNQNFWFFYFSLLGKQKMQRAEVFIYQSLHKFIWLIKLICSPVKGNIF